jgi:hypothetical protein
MLYRKIINNGSLKLLTFAESSKTIGHAVFSIPYLRNLSSYIPNSQLSPYSTGNLCFTVIAVAGSKELKT